MWQRSSAGACASCAQTLLALAAGQAKTKGGQLAERHRLPRILQVIARLKPAVILMNSGLWRGEAEHVWTRKTFDAIFSAAARAVKPQSGVAIWKTTTPTRVSRGELSGVNTAALAAAARHGWQVFDAKGMGQGLTALQPPVFLDDGHLAGQSYGELNNALLNMLCP